MNRLNTLSAKAWVLLSKSTWITQALLAWCDRTPLPIDVTFLKKQRHRRMKSMNDRPVDETRVKLIQLFTQPNQCVFDPHLHDGDTLQAALVAGRPFIGVGKNAQACSAVVKRLDETLKEKPYQLLNAAEYQNTLTPLKENAIDLLLTEIPPFNFKQMQHTYDEQFNAIKHAIYCYRRYLTPAAYLVFIIADQRYRDRYYCRHADLIHGIESMRLTLHGVINAIYDRQALTAYGYPSTYVPNIVNEFVVVFRNHTGANQ